MASSFFNSKNCSCSVLAGDFTRNWPPAHAKFACDWQPVAYKLYPRGRQLHIICTRVAASHMQTVPLWPSVAYNMNKNRRNLHATGGHAGTFCMRLAALGYNLHTTGGHSVTRQETSRKEVCKRPSLHHNYIFFSIGKSTYSTMLLTVQLTALRI